MGKKKGDPEPEEPAPVEVEAPVEVVEQTGRDQFVFVDGAKYGAWRRGHTRALHAPLPYLSTPTVRCRGLSSPAMPSASFQLCPPAELARHRNRPNESPATINERLTLSTTPLLFLHASSVLFTPDGEWRSDASKQVMRHGHGTHTDGPEVYTGQWLDDRMHGAGSFTFAAGAFYEGNFEDDQFQGQGTYTWPDGAGYEGEWRENKMHGQGTYSDCDGVAWSGQFFNGKYNNGKVFVPLREPAKAKRS